MCVAYAWVPRASRGGQTESLQLGAAVTRRARFPTCRADRDTRFTLGGRCVTRDAPLSARTHDHRPTGALTFDGAERQYMEVDILRPWGDLARHQLGLSMEFWEPGTQWSSRVYLGAERPHRGRNRRPLGLPSAYIVGKKAQETYLARLLHPREGMAYGSGSPEGGGGAFASLHHHLSDSLARALVRMEEHEGLSPSHVFVSAHAWVVSALTGQSRVRLALGLSVRGREQWIPTSFVLGQVTCRQVAAQIARVERTARSVAKPLPRPERLETACCAWRHRAPARLGGLPEGTVWYASLFPSKAAESGLGVHLLLDGGFFDESSHSLLAGFYGAALRELVFDPDKPLGHLVVRPEASPCLQRAS